MAAAVTTTTTNNEETTDYQESSKEPCLDSIYALLRELPHLVMP